MVVRAHPRLPSVPVGAGEAVSLLDFYAVIEGRAQLVLHPDAQARVTDASAFLARLAADGRRIYGVTTGYGPLACYHVAPEQAHNLQRNLIYHLTSGVGPCYSPEQTRAILAARIISLSQGHSAIRVSTLEFLLRCLEVDLLPLVPQMGTVGASGDLTPLAHLALAWLGEGEVLLKGQRMPAAEALAREGLAPLELTYKEGLALVNGTSAMTGVAARNAILARRALAWALQWTSAYAEALGGRAEAWSVHFSRLRPHPGQQWAQSRLASLLEGSRRVEPVQPLSAIAQDQLVNGVTPEQSLLQDPYTIRCAPQIYGAICDVLDFHDRLVETELNAVTDNPLFFPDEDLVLHGGNFYGQHVGFASDALHMALVKMAIHLERKLARITDPGLNHGLPAFLQPRQTGLQSGFMGAQVTASAILAELRSEAMPASIQSIPTNANNQDVVPMGTIAARKASRALEHLYRLLAIDAMVMAQALELRAADASVAEAGFSPASVRALAWLRQTVPPLIEDRPLGPEIEALALRLASENPPA